MWRYTIWRIVHRASRPVHDVLDGINSYLWNWCHYQHGSAKHLGVRKTTLWRCIKNSMEGE